MMETSKWNEPSENHAIVDSCQREAFRIMSFQIQINETFLRLVMMYKENKSKALGKVRLPKYAEEYRLQTQPRAYKHYLNERLEDTIQVIKVRVYTEEDFLYTGGENA